MNSENQKKFPHVCIIVFNPDNLLNSLPRLQTMSKRAGGLYGGIQFSSGVTYQPTVIQPEPEQVKPTPIVAAPVQQPTPETSNAPAATAASSSHAGGATTKPTAGISILNICDMQPVY